MDKVHESKEFSLLFQDRLLPGNHKGHLQINCTLETITINVLAEEGEVIASRSQSIESLIEETLTR